MEISNLIDDISLDVMFIDSETSLRDLMNSKELAKMIRYLQITAKKKRELLMVTLHQNVSSQHFLKLI